MTELGIAVTPTEPALRDQVSAFLEQAKASGVIAEAISANGVRGVEVAGPGH